MGGCTDLELTADGLCLTKITLLHALFYKVAIELRAIRVHTTNT